MDEVYNAQLRIKLGNAASSDFDLLAICIETGTTGMASSPGSDAVYGWLDIEKDASQPVKVTTISGETIVVKDFILDTASVTNWDYVHILVVLHRNLSEFSVSSIGVFIHTSIFLTWWQRHRTVPYASLLSELFLSFLPNVIVVRWMKEARNLSCDADVFAWLKARETAKTTFSYPLKEELVPLFPLNARSYICLDCTSSNVSSYIMTNTEDNVVVGSGILHGLTGSGKFSKLMTFIKEIATLPPAASSSCTSPEALSTLNSKAVLIILPHGATQWRIRQLHAIFPTSVYKIVEFTTHKHFEMVSWEDILSANIVVTTMNLFHKTWYHRHACQFMSNINWYPDTASKLLHGCKLVHSSKHSRATTKRRKCEVSNPVTRAAAPSDCIVQPPDGSRLFFDQDKCEEEALLKSVDVCSPSSYKCLTETFFTGMTACVSHQLQNAPPLWRQWMKRPILQVIHFPVCVVADVQLCTVRQANIMGNLMADTKWLTDSSSLNSFSWIERVMQWGIILPECIRSIDNMHDQYSMLLSMAGKVQPIPAPYTVYNDTISVCLIDTFIKGRKENVTTDAICPQMYVENVVLVPPSELSYAVLVERERGLLFSIKEALEKLERGILAGLSGDEEDDDDDDDGDDDDDDGDDSDGDDSDGDDGDVDDHLNGVIIVEEEEDDIFANVPRLDSHSDASDSTYFADEEEEDEEESSFEVNSGDEMLETHHTSSIPSIPNVVSSDNAHIREQHALMSRITSELNVTIGKETCKICLVNICNGMISCGHCFCYDCVQEWFGSNKKCPVCMRKCKGTPNFFVPLVKHEAPLPIFCKDDFLAQNLWQQVCTPTNRLSAAMFWLLYNLKRNEESCKPVIIMVDTIVETRKLCELLETWQMLHGVWECLPYNGGIHNRKMVEDKFRNQLAHVVLTKKEITSGCYFTNVNDVLCLCEDTLTEEDHQALALRLGKSTTTSYTQSITIKSCVYTVNI